MLVASEEQKVSLVRSKKTRRDGRSTSHIYAPGSDPKIKKAVTGAAERTQRETVQRGSKPVDRKLEDCSKKRVPR